MFIFSEGLSNNQKASIQCFFVFWKVDFCRTSLEILHRHLFNEIAPSILREKKIVASLLLSEYKIFHYINMENNKRNLRAIILFLFLGNLFKQIHIMLADEIIFKRVHLRAFSLTVSDSCWKSSTFLCFVLGRAGANCCARRGWWLSSCLSFGVYEIMILVNFGAKIRGDEMQRKRKTKMRERDETW